MIDKLYSPEELKEIYLNEKEKYKTAEFGLWDNELKQIEKNLYSDSGTKQILEDLGLMGAVRFMSFSQYVLQIYKYQKENNVSGICSDTIELELENHKDNITYKYPFMSLMQRREDYYLAKEELLRIYNWWHSKYKYAEGVYMDNHINSLHYGKSLDNQLNSSTANPFPSSNLSKNNDGKNSYNFNQFPNEHEFRPIAIHGVKEYVNLFGKWGLLTYFRDRALSRIDNKDIKFHSLVLTVGSTPIDDPDASEYNNIENFIMVFE